MSETVTLVGLDFGTTTSQIAAAAAVVERNARSGRMEFARSCALLSARAGLHAAG